MTTKPVSKPVPKPSAENAEAISGPSATPTVPFTDENPKVNDPQQDNPQTEPLTPQERKRFVKLRRTINEGLQSMHRAYLEIGRSMAEIQKDRLYRATHPNWDAFCKSEFSVARSRSYELIAAAKVVDHLSAMADGKNVPKNERQIRPLTILKEIPQQTQAWTRALELAGKEPVSESHVRKAVKEVQKAIEDSKPPSTTVVNEVKPDWATAIKEKLAHDAGETVFSQPFQWPKDAVDLQLKDGKYVKVIETLDFETAACAIELREKCSECLILINADVNSREGLDISESGDEILNSFSAPFNAIAVKIGALLEDEGNIFMAGDMDDPAKVTWHRLSREIVEEKGLLCLVSE